MPRQRDYFTSSGNRILRVAQAIAMRLQHETIDPDHILLAMTRTQNTDAYLALHDVDVIESKLSPYLSSKHPAKRKHPLHFQGVEFSDASQEVFRLSLIDATLRGDDYIASAHLLIGLMRVPSAMMDDILAHFSLERKAVIKATEYYLDHSIEDAKVRIPITASDDDALGCWNALREALYELTRRR
ncbi:MAG: Clp protease N-terminal domain-containing protein [Chloroflexota bacterium]